MTSLTPVGCETGLFIKLSAGNWAILKNDRKLGEERFDLGFLQLALFQRKLEKVKNGM